MPALRYEAIQPIMELMRTFPIAILSLLPVLSSSACSQDVTGKGQESASTRQQDPAPSDGQTSVPSDFVRYVKVGDGGHLDTAITTYEKDGVKVIFYGAVHIADARCYQELNDRFTTGDALLYELVGPENYRPTKGQASNASMISMLQQGLKRSMEMSFQLDEVDYLADNFVHADMTPAEFQSSMAANGESLLTIMWDMMMGGMDLQRDQADQADPSTPPPKFDLVTAFRSGEGRHLMRVTFAQQLEQMELLSAGGEGSTLLEGRNEKCLRVLEREIKAGKKHLGIYYGAAHLPHMERRLVYDMGFKKVAHEWLVAWDCKKRPDPKIDRVLIKKRRACKKELGRLAGAARDHRRKDKPESIPTVAQLADVEHDGEKLYTGSLVDPWGSEYILRKRKRGIRWEVVSLGPDSKADTDDDIVVVERRRGGL